MKKASIQHFSIEHHVGCFGDYNRRDRVCVTYCALRLRCAIEREWNIRMEAIEELVASDHMLMKIQ